MFCRDGGLRWERQKETFAAIGRYDGVFGAPVCDLWFVGADGAVLEEENFAFKELEKLGSAFVLYRGYEVSGVSDMLFGVQEQGAVRLLKQMGHFELDDDGDLMAWTAGTEAAPGYYDISLRTLTEYRLEEIREKSCYSIKRQSSVKEYPAAGWIRFRENTDFIRGKR